MARLSDVIENFIKDMFIENGEDKVLIQRNELADQFKCAPSQINYVLTTRFTHEKGYLIESRRGGGGYIVIKQISYNDNETRNKLICQAIGDSITYHRAILLLKNILESGIVTEREAEIMKIAINDRTLAEVEDRNKVRAHILKSMLIVVMP